MGGGASRRQPTAAQGQQKLLEATGPKGDPSRDPPALQRRRRVLLGPEAAKAKTQFEGVAPQHQFQAAVQQDSEDVVFQRIGDPEVLQSFRRKAEETQRAPANGYLAENAIELLGLGLEKGNRLAPRLFQIAQVQRVAGNKMRRPLLTCYELLALFSVLRFGKDSDLLELLFCLFDADADDRLSVEDMTNCIFSFLDWKESEAILESKEQEEYAKFDRYKEARRLAELAVKEFGTTDEAESGAASGEEASSGDEVVSAIAPKPCASLDDESTKTGPQKTGKDLDGSDSDLGPSPSSSKLESDSPGAPKTSKEPGKGLTDSDSEKDKLSGKAKVKAKAKAKVKAKAKGKAKSRKSCCFCGPGGKRNALSRLTYTAWTKWLLTAELLPPEFELLLTSDPLIAARTDSGSEVFKSVELGAPLVQQTATSAPPEGGGGEGMTRLTSGSEAKDPPPLPAKSLPADRPGHNPPRPPAIDADLESETSD